MLSFMGQGQSGKLGKLVHLPERKELRKTPLVTTKIKQKKPKQYCLTLIDFNLKWCW